MQTLAIPNPTSFLAIMVLLKAVKAPPTDLRVGECRTHSNALAHGRMDGIGCFVGGV